MVAYLTNPIADGAEKDFNKSAPACAAKAMGPEQRRDMATRVLGGKESASQSARDNHVSRKFVGQQTAKAKQALDEAFAPAVDAPEKVLFWLPVTKSWIRQTALGLSLTCRGSERGIAQFFDDHLNYHLAPGTIHNILADAVSKARTQNAAVELHKVRDVALDEIFQAGKPVLVTVDAQSTFCCLLSLEEHRDADTWGVRLLELGDRGFNPQTAVADFGPSLRAGLAQALPELLCRGDVFHVKMDLTEASRRLDNRAYHAVERRSNLQNKQARQSRSTGRVNRSLTKQIVDAQREEREALTRADDVRTLFDWLFDDILAIAGPPHADRQALFDFVVAELRQRLDSAGDACQRIGKLLANHRDDLLAFVVQLDHELAMLAQRFEVPLSLVRDLLQHLATSPNHPDYWQREAQFHQGAHGRLHELKPAVQKLRRQTVRASSVVENLNSRLRGYFFLRRHLGPDYLELLQFYLNHRRFPRSDRPERKGKSPRELLTGQEHPHWLELLGFQRFERN